MVSEFFKNAADIISALNEKNTGPLYLGLTAAVTMVYIYYSSAAHGEETIQTNPEPEAIDYNEETTEDKNVVHFSSVS